MRRTTIDSPSTESSSELFCTCIFEVWIALVWVAVSLAIPCRAGINDDDRPARLGTTRGVHCRWSSMEQQRRYEKVELQTEAGGEQVPRRGRGEAEGVVLRTGTVGRGDVAGGGGAADESASAMRFRRRRGRATYENPLIFLHSFARFYKRESELVRGPATREGSDLLLREAI